MELIEGIELSKLCDYSFGDQSGQWSNIFTSFMKEANSSNLEFIEKLNQIKKSRNYMTLFIDNIRLYKRNIENTKPEDKEYVQSLMEKNDLLNLCSDFKYMNFIIFTNLEDTPIDEYIDKLIPENVLCISAVNAIFWNKKVIPAPYGIQRKMHPNDNKSDILKQVMRESIFPKNLLYVNHNENTNLKERQGLNELFDDQSWSLVDRERVEYYQFLRTIKNFKFVLCPIGNAVDCHRNWEVLYLGRVPVMKKHPYLQELYKDYPVLFVDSYDDISEELLIENDFLYKKVKSMSVDNLTLPNFYDNIVDNCTKLIE
jgi:hypothetical protein